MTLQHGNRLRQTSGIQAVQEIEASEPVELTENMPTESEIRQRAYEIYLSRNGAPGDAAVDWLQAELELRARKDANKHS